MTPVNAVGRDCERATDSEILLLLLITTLALLLLSLLLLLLLAMLVLLLSPGRDTVIGITELDTTLPPTSGEIKELSANETTGRLGLVCFDKVALDPGTRMGTPRGSATLLTDCGAFPTVLEEDVAITCLLSLGGLLMVFTVFLALFCPPKKPFFHPEDALPNTCDFSSLFFSSSRRSRSLRKSKSSSRLAAAESPFFCALESKANSLTNVECSYIESNCKYKTIIYMFVPKHIRQYFLHLGLQVDPDCRL